MAPHFKIVRAHGGRVAGVDEAVPRRLRPLIDDSKALTPAAREVAYAALIRCPGIQVAVGAASVDEILRINILHAAMLAMSRALHRLPTLPDLALIDGNCSPPVSCATQCCIGGDASSLSIAAASIVAKVVRDRAMARLATRHPQFGWHENAGYGTRHHRAALAEHGPTPHHRAAFGTVRMLLATRLASTEGQSAGSASIA
jgi:ribonuclease HII